MTDSIVTQGTDEHRIQFSTDQFTDVHDLGDILMCGLLALSATDPVVSSEGCRFTIEWIGNLDDEEPT